MHGRHVVPTQILMLLLWVRIGIQNEQPFDTLFWHVSLHPQRSVCMNWRKVIGWVQFKRPVKRIELVDRLFNGYQMPFWVLLSIVQGEHARA